ncbi:hypothetical protein [Evansella clarkii]|uniref:hypothetical protein n=1 Tax=Evansella clarkii TaxID=79879 RepID=UPI000B44D1B0|nr:hypothetical protein [Evansella clarkii]
MARKYNIGKKSDMRRFTKDLEKSITNQFEKAVHTSKFDYKCPNCNRNIKISSGMNTCPYCSQTIQFNVK